MLAVLAMAAATSACGNLTAIEEVLIGSSAGALYGSRSPAHEIQQTYYLGVFDPQEQLPPTVYRVRLHGQANALSFVKFASGWLPAATVDSLGTTIRWEGKDAKGTKVGQVQGPTIGPADGSADNGQKPASIFKGRRLVLFGPEGFREAPDAHRLVIAMGTDPQAYFDASNQAMGVIAQALHQTGGDGTARLDAELFAAVQVALERRKALARLKARIDGRPS